MYTSSIVESVRNDFVSKVCEKEDFLSSNVKKVVLSSDQDGNQSPPTLVTGISFNLSYQRALYSQALSSISLQVRAGKRAEYKPQ